MTGEELLVHPDCRHSDLVAGTLRVGSPHGGLQGRLLARIAYSLGVHVDRYRLGTVLVGAGFVLARNPDTVRGPDVSFVRLAMLDPDQLPDSFLSGAPDLAVEILPFSESRSAVDEKVPDYRAAGTRLVWVADPMAQTVTVHRPTGGPTVVADRDRLGGEGVVPGYSIVVSGLFR